MRLRLYQPGRAVHHDWFHRHWRPDVRLTRLPAEAVRQDADDGQPNLIYMESLAEDVNSPGESTLPESVTDQSDRMSAGSAIVVLGEDPSMRRVDS